MEKTLIFSTLTVVINILSLSSVTCQSLTGNKELKKFCVIFAIPGIQPGPKFNLFKTEFEQQLENAGRSIFGNIPHENRMKKSENCLPFDSSSPQCAYRRIATIYNNLHQDLSALQRQIGTRVSDASYLYTILLSAWYLDRVFLSINCGPVNIKTNLPVTQWNYIAKLSNYLNSREKFCTWSKALGKTGAKYLRQDVKNICLLKTEPICQLIPFFDFVDTVENLCDIVPASKWTTNFANWHYFEEATYISFYSMRLQSPTDIATTFNSRTEKEFTRKAILKIFFKMYDDFRNSDMILLIQLLRVLPDSRYLPCDFTAQFPSFEWLICATSKSFTELRAFIETSQIASPDKVQKRKFLVADVDYKSYIKELKTTQIKQLAEQHTVGLEAVAAEIKNNVQERFQQLGTYFNKVATFEKKKLNADIIYVTDRIEMYKKRFEQYSKELATKMVGLFMINIGTAAGDLAQAIGKMVIRIAKAGNPLKWLFDSGNADDILESATEIAEASMLLTNAIRNMVNFNKLVQYNIEIARKLLKNKKMIQSMDRIVTNIKQSVETGDEFEKHQSEFLKSYEGYSPQVSSDDLAKLDAYWDLFISDVCDDIAASGSIAASAIKGIAGSQGLCREAKIKATQLVACQEDIHDLQFELVETMASIVRSMTQIQSSKILGSGPKAKHPSGLGIEDIKTLVSLSSLSYKVMQMTNVQMLCNILEYKHGRKPSACTGLSTDIDKLVSLRDPTCHAEFHYVSVPSKPPSNNISDRAWIDLSKLYKGEIVQFQIPDSNWLTQHLHLLQSQKLNSFYVDGIEIYVPAVSELYRPILTTAMPTNINNKLKDYIETNYVIKPVGAMRMKYSEGSYTVCRLPKMPNPYSKCGRKERKMPQICPHSLGTESLTANRLFPSIYSQFNLQLEGYENKKLDVPVTNVPVKIGLKYCYVDSSRPFAKKQMKERSRFNVFRQTSNQCCPPQQYYVESSRQCEPCPSGSRSFYDGLFCGEVIKVLVTPDLQKKTALTYSQAAKLCKDNGSEIASSALLLEARNLGSKSCECGWLEGSVVDSISKRSDCGNQSCPGKGDIKYVHCTMVYGAVGGVRYRK